MSILEETSTLAHGVTIPRLGLGTWFIDDADAAQAVRDAVALGYRNIDTAQAYGNERGVGEGVRTCGIDRSELFVSSKIAAEIKDHDGAAASLDATLETMGLDHLDLVLIHSPQPWEDFRGGDYSAGNAEVWRALEEALEAGKVRAIGVSNFLPADLDALARTATVTPHVNQVLVHVGNTPDEVLEYCADNDILVEAYSPIAHGAMLQDEAVAAMAKDYGVSVPQLCIRYTLQIGTVSLPKTANPDHMRSNAEVDFVISDQDMATLRAMAGTDYGEHAAFPVYSGR